MNKKQLQANIDAIKKMVRDQQDQWIVANAIKPRRHGITGMTNSFRSLVK